MRETSGVGQVRPAREGVVDDEDVAKLRRALADGGHRFGHRAQVDGNVLRLRDHSSVFGEERRGAIAALLADGENAERTSTAPISSATARNPLPRTWSSIFTGSSRLRHAFVRTSVCSVLTPPTRG